MPDARAPGAVLGREAKEHGGGRQDRARLAVGTSYDRRLLVKERQPDAQSEPNGRLGDRNRDREKPRARRQEVTDIKCPIGTRKKTRSLLIERRSSLRAQAQRDNDQNTRVTNPSEP